MHSCACLAGQAGNRGKKGIIGKKPAQVSKENSRIIKVSPSGSALKDQLEDTIGERTFFL